MSDSNVHLDRSVDELELSVRSYNCLKVSNIKTIRELVQIPRRELLAMRNFGRKSLREIEEILISMGLGLVDAVDDRKAAPKFIPKPVSFSGHTFQERHVRISKAATREESRYALSSTVFRKNSIFATDGRILAITQNDTGYLGQIEFNGNHIVSGSESLSGLPRAERLAEQLPNPDDDQKITLVLDNLFLQRVVAAICKDKKQIIKLEFVADRNGRVNSAIAVQAGGVEEPKSYGLLMPCRWGGPQDCIHELARLLRDEPIGETFNLSKRKENSNV